VSSGNGLKVLSIDGGGYCCLSAILTIMHLLGAMEDSEDAGSLRPCEYFDLIGGLGSGGLVAILFGCLRMTCREAIEAYVWLGRLLYLERQEDGPRTVVPCIDAVEFTKELESIVSGILGSSHALMKDAGTQANGDNTCRVSTLLCDQPLYAHFFYIQDFCSCTLGRNILVGSAIPRSDLLHT
jgi:hypothetical protein